MRRLWIVSWCQIYQLFFQDLENSASSDAIVREKIARLPPDVSEVVHLEKLKSAKEGAELMEKVIIFTFLSKGV